jgi:hypothetical protein
VVASDHAQGGRRTRLGIIGEQRRERLPLGAPELRQQVEHERESALVSSFSRARLSHAIDRGAGSLVPLARVDLGQELTVRRPSIGDDVVPCSSQ